MDMHNKSNTPMVWGWDTKDTISSAHPAGNSDNRDLARMRARVVDASNGRRSFVSTGNKMIIELVTRIIELYHCFLPGETAARGKEAAERAWAEYYKTLGVDFSWPTACQLFEICQLASEHKRLYYISTPLVDLAPYSKLLSAKLASGKEHAFWSTFGSGSRKTHNYTLGLTEYSDIS